MTRHAWLKRIETGYESNRTIKDKAISRELIKLHSKYPTLGLDCLYNMLKTKFNCGRNRIHKLKKKFNIYSIRKKAYKVTTNSKHNNPVAPNLLNKEYRISKTNQVWAGRCVSLHCPPGHPRYLI